MLWRVEGTSVHMVASVHYLTASDYPMPAPLDAAYRSADLLVLEADVGALGGLVLGRFADGLTLSDIAPNDYGEILAAFNECGVPTAEIPQTEPWLLGFQLMNALLNQRGYEHPLGLDAHLRNRAEKDKKSMVFLEEPMTPLLCFQSGGYPRQVERLRFLIRNTEYIIGLTMRTLQAWRTCSLNELQKIYDEQVARFPDMHACLIDARNQNWMQSLRRVIGLGKPALVCVGAMHFVGDKALPNLLRVEGLTTKRIPYT
jgi:uncharacterized protein YbaP (TraB family)